MFNCWHYEKGHYFTISAISTFANMDMLKKATIMCTTIFMYMIVFTKAYWTQCRDKVLPHCAEEHAGTGLATLSAFVSKKK